MCVLSKLAHFCCLPFWIQVGLASYRLNLVLNLYELNNYKMVWFQNKWSVSECFQFWLKSNTVICRKLYEAFSNPVKFLYQCHIIIANNLWILERCDFNSFYFFHSGISAKMSPKETCAGDLPIYCTTTNIISSWLFGRFSAV